MHGEIMPARPGRRLRCRRALVAAVIIIVVGVVLIGVHVLGVVGIEAQRAQRERQHRLQVRPHRCGGRRHERLQRLRGVQPWTSLQYIARRTSLARVRGTWIAWATLQSAGICK